MKEASQQKDNWNANLYDSKHSFVSLLGNNLIDLLAPQKGEKILDLGCGTGDLAKKISEFGASVIGVDGSENMVMTAKSKFPKISFMVQDATNLSFHCEFDAVFSNAVLHWVKPPKQALQGILNGLKPGGRFVAEFGGKGNVQSITDELIHQIRAFGFNFELEDFPWYYPSIGEYTSMMEEVGFRVTFAQHIDRPTPLEGKNGLSNWLEMFGTSFFKHIPAKTKMDIIKKVEQNLESSLFDHNSNSWIADYKRIRVVGIRE